MRKNILVSGVDFSGNVINFLPTIERDDTVKVYASVWELDKNYLTVLTKDGKVVLNKVPPLTLLRLIGKQFESEIFASVQVGEPQLLAEVHKVTHGKV